MCLCTPTFLRNISWLNFFWRKERFVLKILHIIIYVNTLCVFRGAPNENCLWFNVLKNFIFVYGVRKCSSFVLLQVVDQIYQHHLLKRLSLIHCIFLPPLLKIRCPYVVLIFLPVFTSSFLCFPVALHPPLLGKSWWCSSKEPSGLKSKFQDFKGKMENNSHLIDVLKGWGQTMYVMCLASAWHMLW